MYFFSACLLSLHTIGFAGTVQLLLILQGFSNYTRSYMIGTPPRPGLAEISLLTGATFVLTNPYDPLASSSLRSSGIPSLIHYLSSDTLFGYRVADLLRMPSSPPVAVLDTQFIYGETPETRIGLGPASANFLGEKSRCMGQCFVEGMLSTTEASGGRFITVDLFTERNEGAGAVFFGMRHDQSAKSPIYTFPPFLPLDYQLWTTFVSDIILGEHMLELNGATTFDIRQPYLLLPVKIADVIAKLLGAIRVSGSSDPILYQFPENIDPDELSELTMQFGTLQIPIRKSMLVNGTLLMIAGQDVTRHENAVWILGVPFLRSAFLALNYDTNEVSIALPNLL